MILLKYLKIIQILYYFDLIEKSISINFPDNLDGFPTKAIIFDTLFSDVPVGT